MTPTVEAVIALEAKLAALTQENADLRQLLAGMEVMLLDPVRQTIDAAEVLIRADAKATAMPAAGPEREGMERAISVMRAMLNVTEKAPADAAVPT